MTGDWRRTRLSSLVRKVATCLPEWKLYEIALAREPRPGFWQVIDFQLDKYVTKRRYIVNLGLHDTSLEPLLTGWPRIDTERPDTGSCNLTRVRLGQLAHDDRWWDLPSEDKLDAASRQLCSLLTKFAIPELEHLRSNQGIVEAWMNHLRPRRFFDRKRSPWFPRNKMVLAAVLKDLGRDQEARDVATAEIMASVGHPSEAWVKTAAARLGL